MSFETLQEAEDDDEQRISAPVRADRLTREAAVARASVATTFPYLTQLIHQRQQALEQAAAAGAAGCAAGQGIDPSVVLEQLCWLLEVASYCLADSAAGETALVPDAVAAAAAQQGSGGVQQLSSQLLDLAALCLKPSIRPVISPRYRAGAAQKYFLPCKLFPRPASCHLSFIKWRGQNERHMD